jgi:signal transduction histidine kinase
MPSPGEMRRSSRIVDGVTGVGQIIRAGTRSPGSGYDRREGGGDLNGVWGGLRDALIGADPPPLRARSARRWRTTRTISGIVGVGFGLIAWGSLTGRQNTLVVLVFAVGLGLPVLLLPDRPLLALRIIIVVALLSAPAHVSLGNDAWPWHPLTPIEFAAALVAVGMRHPFRVLAWVWGITVLVIVLCAGSPAVPGLVIAASVLLLLGDQIRRRGEAQRGLRAQEELSAAEQARRAVLEERTRIARELHDVVAHHMSLIAVRAETAPYRLGEQSTENAAEFAAIAEQARLSLTEMRRLLGVLRSDGSGPPELAPQPGLADVATLVGTAREAGAQVALQQDGALADVPDGVGLTGYRVVQEALANAGRHAPGAPVHVQVRGSATDLRIVVANGPAVLAVAPTEPGASPHGLVGMRERVTGLGGHFEAGPTADGGFRITATLPKQEPT